MRGRKTPESQIKERLNPDVTSAGSDLSVVDTVIV
jgi:hypothetical protein